MSKKKIFLLTLLIILVFAGVFIRQIYPYLTFSFVKDALFPPPEGVDSLTRATLPVYTKSLDRQRILELIRSGPEERMMVIGTVNPDGSPQAEIPKISVDGEQIVITGNPELPDCRNIARNKEAVLTVYSKPSMGARWFDHIGARLWLKLESIDSRIPQTHRYVMTVTAARPL